MAALAVSLRAMLANIGFSNEASTYIVDTQGFNTPEDCAILTDEEAQNLCKITRKPGGLDQHGDPNPGIVVSMKAENNLKMASFYFRYRQRTTRPLTVNLCTTATLQNYVGHSRFEKDHSDPDAPELRNMGNWTRTIDVIEDYLRNCLGTTKVPLAWIIREQVVPLASADDPSTNYPTYAEELIARAPHHNNADPPVYTQAYKDDNIIVFNKLASLLRDKDCWTYMQHATRRRDGRSAFMGLKDHYLGKNNVDNQATMAERKLQTTSYTGEGRRWNFKKYVQTHVNQHQILTDLTRHGYTGIDPRSKVRYLMDGIKTKELNHVKTRIMSDTGLRSDFEASVNLFQDFIKQDHAEPRQSHISALERESGGGQKGEGFHDLEPDMAVEDQYYTDDEYNKLTPAQKKGVDDHAQCQGTQKRLQKLTYQGHTPKKGKEDPQQKSCGSRKASPHEDRKRR